MTTADARLQQELAELTTRSVEGDLTPAGHQRLAELLTAHPALVDDYVELLNLRAAIRFDALTTPVVHPVRAASAGRTNPYRITPVAWSLAAAVLLAAAAVAIYVFAFSNPQSEIRDPKSVAPVATLIESTAPVVFENQVAYEGGEYPAGTYSIEDGAAEFLLSNRVGVGLRGDTQLDIHTPTHATLARGSVTFDCPAGVSDYTVDIPDGARVVDLGTRFTVDVKPDGGLAAVRVLEGRVRIEHPTLTEPVELIAGQLLVGHRTADAVAFRVTRAVESGFTVTDFSTPDAIGNDGELVEANNIGASGKFNGISPGPLPAVTVNGIDFGTDQSAITSPIFFAGDFVENTLADPDLNTLMRSIAGSRSPQPMTLHLDNLEPGRTYRLQLLVMLGAGDRVFEFSVGERKFRVDLPVNTAVGKIVTYTWTAEAPSIDINLRGERVNHPSFEPFINAYALHRITPQ